MKVLCILFFIISSVLHAQSVNIALHKKVTLNPNPQKMYNKTPRAEFITDGKQVGNSLANDGYVNWLKTYPTITIDLEKIENIRKVTYHTSIGGLSNIKPPKNVLLYISEDNKQWEYVADLAEGISYELNGKYQKFILEKNIKATGRFFQFRVKGEKFYPLSEIELFSAASELTSSDKNKITEKVLPEEHFAKIITYPKAKKRLEIDEDSFYQIHKKHFDISVVQSPENSILPINATHLSLFKEHGKLLAKKGFKPLTFWKKHRYYNLQPIEYPVSEELLELNIKPCLNWVLSDAVNVTNSSPNDIKITAKVNHPKIKVFHTTFVDTYNNIATASWLQEGDFILKAGMSAKIWVQANKINQSQQLELNVNGNIIPVNIEVAPIETPDYIQAMSWDYNDRSISQEYFNLPSNVQFIKHNRGKYVYVFIPHHTPEKSLDQIKKSGVELNRIFWCPVDEAKTEDQFERIKAAWLYKQIHAPEIRIFVNPLGNKELIEKYARFIDVIVPHPYEAEKLLPGKIRGFYNWSGQNTFSDPQLTFRLLPIIAAKNKAEIVGWWLYERDRKGYEGKFNAYLNAYPSYEVWFNDDPSIHLEAVREGIQNANLLSMYPEFDISDLTNYNNPKHEWRTDNHNFDTWMERLKSTVIRLKK